MKKSNFSKLLLILNIVGILLSACTTANTIPTETIQTAAQNQSQKTTENITSEQNISPEEATASGAEFSETLEFATNEANLAKTPTVTATAEAEETDEVATEAAPLTGKIVIWHALNYTETVGLSTAMKTFKEANPDVEFQVLYVPYNELQDKFETAAANGGGPDLLIGGDDWGPPLYSAKMVANVSDLQVSNIIETAMRIGQFKDAQVGLPYVLKGVVMYRNQSIIREPATSFEDLKEKAETATSSNIEGALLEISAFYSIGHLYGLGGALMTAEGNPAFNTSEGIAWLEMLQDFNALGADYWNTDSDYKRFRTGNVGIIIDGTWNLGDLSVWLKDKLVIDPWPRDMSGFVQAGMIYLNANSTGENQTAAKALMTHLLSSESQTAFYKADASFIPVNTTVEVTDPLRKQAQIAFEGGIPWIVLPELSGYWGPIERLINGIFETNIEPTHLLFAAEQEVMGAIAEIRAGQ